METKKERIYVRIDEELKKLAQMKAAVESTSLTDYIIQLIQLDVTKDIGTESAVLFHYEELKRCVKKMDAKVEELSMLFLDYLQMFFRTQPEIARGALGQEDLARAQKRTVDFIEAHRNKLKRSKAFMESIFGDMLEIEESPDRKEV